MSWISNDSAQQFLVQTSKYVDVKGVAFRMWVHKRVPFNSQWLVFKIGGADLFDCWATS